MATYSPYNDSVFLFRLQTLIIDGGTDVVRNIFNNRLNNIPLVTFLATEKTTINRLRAQKTITKVQYDQLFPPGGQNPDCGDFDITLLMCLLRNIPALGLNRMYPWHTSPRPTDTSVEADLIRLRTFRNEIAHASSTHCLDEPAYKQQWNKVEQCLLRLNSGPHSDPNLQATLDSFKKSPLDPDTEQRLDKQWKELENSLESEINMLKENMTYNRKEIGEVSKDVGEIKGGIVVVTGDVAKAKEDIDEIKGGIAMVTGDVDKAKEDIDEMKGGIAVVTGDVDKAKEDIDEMKGGIAMVTGDVDKAKEDIDVMNGGIAAVTGDVYKAREDIDEMKGGIAKVTGDVDKAREDIDEMKGGIAVVTGDVDKAKEDIDEMKGGIAMVTGDVDNAKEDIDEMKGGIAVVTGDVDKAKEDIDVMKGGITMVTGDVDKAREDINEMKGGIAVVTGDVDKAKEDIDEMKGGITMVTGDVDKAREDIDEMKGGMEHLGGRVDNLEEQIQNIDTKLSNKQERREHVSPEEKQTVMTTPTSQQENFSLFKWLIEPFRRKRRLKQLQKDLIDSYRSDHSEMYLAPLLDKGTPLLQFYQMPDLVHVTEIMEQGRAVKEERTPVDTWDTLFHGSNHANHRSTYICADAGLGKTAFSKYLARAWCQSKNQLQKESQFFKPEHLRAISKFRFVFLLFLRESRESKCYLKEMIWEQLVSKLVCSHGLEDLENILRNEKCLIILDGLDEWTHPPTCSKSEKVPHWSKRENVTVITTTRPWKFSVAGLKSGQFDQRIDLTGLNQESANNLKYSFLSYFKMQKLKVKCLGQQDKDEVTRNVQRFTRTVSDKHAAKLESVPLMLMYMLFLYFKDFDFGETQCDLYCQIIELLLSRVFEEKQELVTSTTEKNPPCFNKQVHVHCLKFYNPYLKLLGELAFKTLFEEKSEENTLVFDSSVAIKCLGEECFKQCLKTGIISQSKCVQTHPLIQKSTVSFSHKTMQELFAALYMYSEPDDTRMSQLVLSKCKNVQDILDMSKIIMFISGMNVNVAALISRGMMNIINEDETTQEYRNTAGIESYGNPLIDLQKMFVSCCKEMPCACGDNLYIQDVFIDESCEDEQYRIYLKQLIQNNKNNIKSVRIDMLDMKDTPYNSEQKVVEYFELKDLKNLVKIVCWHGEDTENIIPVLNTQVKYLELTYGSWSRSLCEKVTSLQKLEVIYISLFTMSHSELRLLYDFISQRVDMREIVLDRLDCSDHEERSCSGLRLDLSQHSQLRWLVLGRIPRPELNINMASSEKRVLEWLPLADLRFTRVTCDKVDSRLNLKLVHLFDVTIPASVLKDILTFIQTLPQTVGVDIWRYCVIKPKREWKTLKQQIQTSPHFTVPVDDGSVFEFETIKHGN